MPAKGKGGKLKKQARKNDAALFDDEKLQRLVVATLKYGLGTFGALLVTILSIKKSGLNFPSPHEIMEGYVLTRGGVGVLLALLVLYVSRTIYFTKMKEYVLRKIKERHLEQEKLKSEKRRLELESRKIRSSQIDLKETMEASNVTAAGMRIREKDHTVYKTVRVGADASSDNDKAKSTFSNAWRKEKGTYKKSKQDPIDTFEEWLQNETYEDLVSKSDEYLAQPKERVEIDLDNNLASGKAKNLDVTVCCTISVRWKISLLRLNTLKLHVGCERCIKSYGVNVSGQWLNESKSRKRCTKCSSIFDVEIRPTLCHENSKTLCNLQINKAICKDILDGTTLIATCDKCGAESVMPPIRRKVRVEKKCYSCHTKMALCIDNFSVEGCQGELKSKKTKKSSSTKGAQHHILQLGEPLPLQGACEHFEKSYRWYRFPCCGGAYPCPICHAKSGNCDQTDVLANQMICGKCSYQMAYSESKPCRKCGFEFGMEKVSNKKNLEKITLRKMASSSKQKTASKKKHRVGALGKLNTKGKMKSTVK